jgi:hypothetical protein
MISEIDPKTLKFMREQLPAAIGHLRGLGPKLHQCDCCGQMKETTNFVAFGMDTSACDDCRQPDIKADISST